MQNYAKFDSRIAEESMQFDSYTSSSSLNSWYYGWSFLSDIINLFEDLIQLLSIFLVWSFFILWFFLFLYIIVSLFTKWWEKTSDELKYLWNIFTNFIKTILLFLWKIIRWVFYFFFKRKFLSFLIILFFIWLNFVWNIFSGDSKILKLSKIESSYVWVDLENKKILNPGYHLYSPIKTSFFLSPTSNFDFEIAEVTANTSEELWVNLDYRVWFKIKDSSRLAFYEEYWAKNIRLVSSDIVMPKLLEVIKWIIKEYSFKDISSKHDEIKAITIKEANKVLIEIWIELQDVNILDIRLPSSYLKSKEDLLKAENELKLAEAKLEAQKKESEKKVLEAENSKKVKIIEAEAIAEYNKKINSTEITDMIIETKKLEIEELKAKKWDWKLPTHIWSEFEF